MPAESDFLENQRASLPARRGVPDSEEARGRLPLADAIGLQHGAAAKAAAAAGPGDSGAANLRSAGAGLP